MLEIIIILTIALTLTTVISYILYTMIQYIISLFKKPIPQNNICQFQKLDISKPPLSLEQFQNSTDQYDHYLHQYYANELLSIPKYPIVDDIVFSIAMPIYILSTPLTISDRAHILKLLNTYIDISIFDEVSTIKYSNNIYYISVVYKSFNYLIKAKPL